MKIQSLKFKTQNHISKLKTFLILSFGFAFCTFNFAFSTPAFADPIPQWGATGIVINDTPGSANQEKPQTIYDGNGGYIIAWEDSRSGFYDIYCQKIDENGTSLWGQNGIALCTASGNQNSVQLVSDGRGGAIIVWQDFRGGSSDIFAQHINSAGALLWANNGVVISDAAKGQFAPKLAADSSGGAIITWHDYRSGKGEDIYAQKINYQGQILWTSNGLVVSNSPSTQWYPEITSDNRGGAVIAWTDSREGPANYNIYAQHLDASGKSLWEQNGLPISSADKRQEQAQIIGAANNSFIIAWQDFRNNNTDIFAQKIDGGGIPQWAKDGVAVCQASNLQDDFTLSSDDKGGTVIAWRDQRQGKGDIYCQRLSPSGQILWAENGTPISRAAGAKKEPRLVKITGKEEWVVLWEDSRNGGFDLYAQKISGASTPLWKADGIAINTSANIQNTPCLAASPYGSVLAVFEDKSSGSYSIIAQKITSAGTLALGPAGKTVCAALGSSIQQNIAAIDDGTGNAIVIFEDNRSGYFNIYAQKVSKNSSLLWGINGVPLEKIDANQQKASLVADGSGGAIIVWEDSRIRDLPSIRLQRIDASGKLLWSSAVLASPNRAGQTEPKIISDGSGGAIVIWLDSRNTLSQTDIYGQRVSPQGTLLWGESGKAIAAESGTQTHLTMASDNNHGAFIAWTDYRRGERNPDIYAQRLNAQGELLWDKGGAVICSAPDVQRVPQIASDPFGGAIISWTDKGGGSYDIYAQKVSDAGQTLWRKDGIPVCQLSRTQQNAKFGSSNILVWEDYRYGSWDIFAQALNDNGKLRWLEEGAPIVLLPQSQLYPEIIEWKNNSTIVAWQDYRDSSSYEIHLQQIGQDGKTSWQTNGYKNKSRAGAEKPVLVGIPNQKSLYLFWEDTSSGGKAIMGQRYLVN